MSNQTVFNEDNLQEELPICGKCFLIECCCEEDKLQVIKDDERARLDGYIEINGRWVKPSRGLRPPTKRSFTQIKKG
jgi:hypothetical protein